MLCVTGIGANNKMYGFTLFLLLLLLLAQGMKDARLKAHFHAAFASGNRHGRMPLCTLATLFGKSNRMCSRLDPTCDSWPLQASALVLEAARLSPRLTCHVSPSSSPNSTSHANSMSSGTESSKVPPESTHATKSTNYTNSTNFVHFPSYPTTGAPKEQTERTALPQLPYACAWVERKDPFPEALVSDFMSRFNVPTDPPSGSVTVVVIPCAPAEGGPRSALALDREGGGQAPDRAGGGQAPGRAGGGQAPGRAGEGQAPGRAGSGQAPGRAGEGGAYVEVEAGQAFEMKVRVGDRVGGRSVWDCLAAEALGLQGMQGLMSTR